MTEMDKDWIKLNRGLMLNDLWKDEPFTRGQAWVDLLMLANWKSGIALVKGEPIPYERGQICRAMKQLALRWKWSEGKVKRYLELLENLEQISFENWPKNGAQKRYVTTLISITNYNTYQSNGACSEREQSADGAQTERGQSGVKKVKKKQEGKEVKHKNLLPICKAWHGFKAMRKSIRKPMTDQAEELVIKKLFDLQAKGYDPVEVLNLAIEKSWLSVYDSKELQHGTGGTNRSTATIGGKTGAVGNQCLNAASDIKPDGYFAGDFPDRSDQW